MSATQILCIKIPMPFSRCFCLLYCKYRNSVAKYANLNLHNYRSTSECKNSLWGLIMFIFYIHNIFGYLVYNMEVKTQKPHDSWHNVQITSNERLSHLHSKSFLSLTIVIWFSDLCQFKKNPKNHYHLYTVTHSFSFPFPFPFPFSCLT